VPVIGAVALSLSLGSGVSALATTAADASVTHAPTQPVLLHEEEISDVSLATFHVFDKETATTRRPRLRLTQGAGCGGCGCACGTGLYTPPPVFGSPVYPPPPPTPVRSPPKNRHRVAHN
jgi:hypothetical protein